MNRSSRRRRPTAGGYARGEEARLRIIRAAIRLFGRLGFDSASTRGIAAEAGVNPPALQYYFDGKEGVYRACAEHIAQQSALAMAAPMRRAERLLDDNADARRLIDAYCEIMEAFADLLFCNPEGRSWSPMLSREHSGLGPDVAYPLLRDRFLNPFHALCARLLCRITGMELDAPETVLRMTAINGQFLAFLPVNGSLLASLGWSEVRPELGGFIKSMVVDHTRALLEAELRSARATGPAARALPAA
jgi:AcrR family transcriptional regulator